MQFPITQINGLEPRVYKISLSDPITGEGDSLYKEVVVFANEWNQANELIQQFPNFHRIIKNGIPMGWQENSNWDLLLKKHHTTEVKYIVLISSLGYKVTEVINY